VGVIGGALAYHLLRRLSVGESSACSGRAYLGRSKLEVLLGPEIWERVAGRVVLDYGCGSGQDAIDLARHGARRVIGLDVVPRHLAAARRAADAAGVAVEFTERVDEPVDVIVSLDAFEHFADPAAVLRHMASLLAPGGAVLAAFGPTWYHPYGGHLFSVFPWAHLLFTEPALIRWRADFKTDGATRFAEVAGGLNQMTIRRFERLVSASPLRSVRLEPVAIRGWHPLVRTRLTREAFASLVRCELRRDARQPRVAAHPPVVRDYDAH
jgi:SAM-dependent methyltransferase